jgi:hypothetical protein
MRVAIFYAIWYASLLASGCFQACFVNRGGNALPLVLLTVPRLPAYGVLRTIGCRRGVESARLDFRRFVRCNGDLILPRRA